MKRLVKAIIGLVLLGSIFVAVSPSELIDALSAVSPLTMLVAAGVFITVQTIAALNLYIFFTSFNNVSFPAVFRATWFGLAAGLITPGRIGEFSLVYFLQDAVDEGDTVAVAILDKALTVFVLLAYAAIGTYLYTSISAVSVIIVSIGFVLITALLAVNPGVQTWLGNTLSYYGYETLRDHVIMAFDRLRSLARRPSVIGVNTALTFVKWGLTGAMFYTLFGGFDVSIPLFDHVILSSYMTLSSLIPISLSGLGVRETVGIGLYTAIFGVSSATTAAVVLLALCIRYAFALGVYTWGVISS